MKKFTSALLAFVFILTLASCGGSKTYRNDTACEALAVNSQNKIILSDSSLSFIEKGELSLAVEPYISDAVETASDSEVRFTGGASFDEFGVFHCADSEKAENVKATLERYTQSKAEDEVYRSYFPGEEYKLDEAEVKVFGNYVVYAILSAENRSALFAEIEQLLVEA